jgi:hypothetical protein
MRHARWPAEKLDGIVTAIGETQEHDGTVFIIAGDM